MQQTIERGRKGEIPDPGNNGLLLTSEVDGLDLRAADLVTLSACRTALGESMTGGSGALRRRSM